MNRQAHPPSASRSFEYYIYLIDLVAFLIAYFVSCRREQYALTQNEERGIAGNLKPKDASPHYVDGGELWNTRASYAAHVLEMRCSLELLADSLKDCL